MLRKVSLLYIKLLPIILAFYIGIQNITTYVLIDYNILKIVDYICIIIILIGSILLSFTFKFCIYHRLLLYVLLIYDCCKLLNLFINDIYFALYLFIICIISILFVYFIIHKYLSKK